MSRQNGGTLIQQFLVCFFPRQLFVSEATLQLPRTTWLRVAHLAAHSRMVGVLGAGESRPYASGRRDCARLVEKAELSQPRLSGEQTPKRICYPLEFGPRKVVSSIQRSPVSFNMRSILGAIRLGFHKVTGFLVASDVLEPNPCDFPARDVWYPTPTFTGESTLCFWHSSFSSPPLGLSRFISL